MLVPAPAGDEKRAEAVTASEPDRAVAPPAAANADAPKRQPVAALVGLLRDPRLWAAAVLLGLAAAGLALTAPYLRGWYHLRAARSDLQRYHNPQAVRHLQVCLHMWPDDPDVLILAARAARRAVIYGDAERCMEKYQKVRGCDEAATFEQLLLSAERGVDRVAEQCHRLVDEGHPDAPLILEALTRGYLRQYRLREARVSLHRWRQAQRDNPQMLCLEGQLHFDYERAQSAALESYRQAVRLDPDHEEARLGLAVVALQSKLFSEAEEHLEYLRQCQPDNLRVQVGLAQCRDARGDRDEAVRLLDDVLARRPGYGPALGERGRLAVVVGQYAEAEGWLRQTVALNPIDRQARYNLILCLNQNGKAEEAQQQQKELQNREEDVQRYHDIVTRELPEKPYDAALHCTLGQLLLRIGQNEEGLRWLQSALLQDPQYAPARQAMAEYYQGTRKKEQQPDSE